MITHKFKHDENERGRFPSIRTEIKCDGTVRFSADRTSGQNIKLVIGESSKQVPGTPDKSCVTLEPVVTIEFTSVGSVNALVKSALNIQRIWNERVLAVIDAPVDAYDFLPKSDINQPSEAEKSQTIDKPGEIGKSQTIDKLAWDVEQGGCQCDGCINARQRRAFKDENREKFLKNSAPHPVKDYCDRTRKPKYANRNTHECHP